MFKKSKEKSKVDVDLDNNLEYGMDEDNHVPQNKELVKEIKELTNGVILPTVDGKEHVVVITEGSTKVVVFNVVGNTIYVSGTGWGERLAEVDNTDNPISLDVVKLMNNLIDK